MTKMNTHDIISSDEIGRLEDVLPEFKKANKAVHNCDKIESDGVE